jgi:hypothetical protein
MRRAPRASGWEKSIGLSIPLPKRRHVLENQKRKTVVMGCVAEYLTRSPWAFWHVMRAMADHQANAKLSKEQ